MRRSPFYRFPTYPLRSPRTSFYANDAYHPFLSQQQQRPPPTPTPSASSSSRKVINIPVYDSASVATPSQEVKISTLPPQSKPSTAPDVPAIDPASDDALIQACLRWRRGTRPLLYIYTIAACRAQLEALKAELQSCEFRQKVRSNEKERLRFNKSIMATIVQLDDIEGSIPEIRNRRKEATKMAIQLQDSMDAIMSQMDEDDSNLNLEPAMAIARLEHESEAVLPEEEVMQPTSHSMPQEKLGSQHDRTLQEDSQEDGKSKRVDDGVIQLSCEVDCMSHKKIGGKQERESVDVLDNLELMEAIDDGELQKNSTLEENPPQAKLVEALNDIELSEGGQAPVSDINVTHSVENTNLQFADCDDVCGMEKINGLRGYEMNESKQNDGEMLSLGANEENAQTGNSAFVLHKVTDSSHEHLTGAADCEDLLLNPGTPHREERLDGARHSTDNCLPHAKEFVDVHGPCSDKRLCEQSSQDANECGYDGEERPKQVIPPTVQASGDGQLLASDSKLLKQLSEECSQLKSLLGRLLLQSKAQSKVICALGDRLQMLEHQQQSNQKKQQRGKGKLKKGAARSVKGSQL